MPTKIKYIYLLVAATLTACGTSLVSKNPNTNLYSVTSKQGLVTGGWDTATSEATQKAIDHCASMGQKYYFSNEQRAGVPGFSLLSSTISFNCGADTAALMKDVVTSCEEQMKTSDLNLIRNKVELSRTTISGPPPFEIATNNSFPTQKEKQAISIWAKIREQCSKQTKEALSQNDTLVANAMQRAYADKQMEFRRQMDGQLSALVVALYQSKLTYGEFSQKRYELVESIVSAERDYRAATLIQDRDVQVRSEQLALQQQANNINAWNVYMQSVNARQPQTVRLQSNCNTTRIGNTTTTNCN